MNLPAVFFFESNTKQTTDTTVAVHRIVVTIIIIPTAISTVGNAVQQKDSCYDNTRLSEACNFFVVSAQCTYCHLCLEFANGTHL